MFNGSASLRDAAGQLIENVAKSTRRNETVDEAYMEKLYADVTSLYHLDSLGASKIQSGAGDSGPLPKTSKILLGALVLVWIGIGAYVLCGRLKERAAKKRS